MYVSPLFHVSLVHEVFRTHFMAFAHSGTEEYEETVVLSSRIFRNVLQQRGPKTIVSYSTEDQNELWHLLILIVVSMFCTGRVMEALKDYVLKAVINTVDHLGSMAYKVNGFLDENANQVSETGLRLSCIEQVGAEHFSSVNFNPV